MLVRDAYGGYMKLPTDDSVSGLPDWAKNDYFQIDARMTEADTAAMAKLSQDEKEQRRQVML
jgi:hypothetical protein